MSVFREERKLMHLLYSYAFWPSIRCPGLCSFNSEHKEVGKMEWRLNWNVTARQRLENPTHLSSSAWHKMMEVNGDPTAPSRWYGRSCTRGTRAKSGWRTSRINPDKVRSLETRAGRSWTPHLQEGSQPQHRGLSFPKGRLTLAAPSNDAIEAKWPKLLMFCTVFAQRDVGHTTSGLLDACCLLFFALRVPFWWGNRPHTSCPTCLLHFSQ